LPLQSAPSDTNTASEYFIKDKSYISLAIFTVIISIISLLSLFSDSTFGYYISCDAPRA
jgi:hypothetical protein